MKKRHYALLIVSLLFSFAALAASIRLEPFVVGMETYLGVTSAFIGICATFIVGWQIFSSMNVREELNKNDQLKTRLEDKIELLNTLIVEQKKAIDKEKEARLKLQDEMECNLNIASGLAFSYTQPLNAYSHFANTIKYYLEEGDDDSANDALSNMSASLAILEDKINLLKGKQKEDFSITDRNGIRYSENEEEEIQEVIKEILNLKKNKELIKKIQDYEARRKMLISEANKIG